MRTLGAVLAALLLTSWAVAAGPQFQDGTAALGLTLGGGQACWVDLDQDGWTDLCVDGIAWRNEAGKGFTKLAEGFGAGVVAADFDNDGFPDLFSWSSLKLSRNQGGKNFAAVTLPELPKCVSRGACWGDFNRDGWADLYVGGYEDWDAGLTYPNLLLLNDRGQGFKLAWTEERYRSRGVTACDFDEDGDLDVYVSNYRLQPNVLRVNDGQGKLQDQAAAHNVIATAPGFDGGHAIGAAWGDFDNDGHFDLFAGNFAHVDSRGDQPKSRFLRNQGPTAKYVFEDKGTCGVFYQESYASPTAGDYDNDGDVDVFFTTVYGTASFGRPNFPVLFRNDGGYKFVNRTGAAALPGLPPTYQAAWADFDNDGDLDLVSAGRLFVNQGTGNHWLTVRLEGAAPASNRSALGAQVRVLLRSRVLARQVEAGTGEGNQNDLALHFGLNTHRGPVRLEIRWPDGQRQVLSGVAVDQVWKLKQGAAP